MSLQQVNVLLIEDETRDARLIQAMLEAFSEVAFNIEHVDRLSKGLQRLSKGGIDAVLLDLSLPDSRGMETFTKLQTRFPDVPVVAMTGLDDQVVAAEAVKLGAQDYLIKGQVDQGLIARSLIYAIERRRSRQELSESEAKYAMLVEKAKDMVAIIQDGVWKFANPAAEEMTGYKIEELLEKPFADILAPECRETVMARYEARRAGEPVPSVYEAKILHKDGTLAYVEISSAIVQYQGKPANMKIVRDITERKEAEEIRRESEERFRILVENAEEAMAIVAVDGSIMYESPSNEHVLGYRSEGIKGTSIVKWTHPDDVKVLTDLWAGVVGNPSAVVSGTFRCKHKDGSWRTIEAKAKNMVNNPVIRGLVVNYRDVTSHRMAEEAIKNSEERFRSLIEKALDALIIVDDKVRELYRSPSLSRMLGYEEGEWAGRALLDVVHPDDLPRVLEGLNKIMKAPGAVDAGEVRIRHNDGSWHHVEIVGTNRLDVPSIRGFVVNLRDITDRRRAEDALRQSEEKLRELVERLKLSQEALSTPVVQLWDNVLALPLIGVVDEGRAQRVMEVLLRNIVDTQSELVILDVTGVAAMDSQVASYIMQTVRSASLLGAKCILTGIRPEVAQTVIELGLDMNRVVIKKDMREGLKWSLQDMGYRLGNGHRVIV